MVPMFIGALAMAIFPDRIGVALNIGFLEKAALPALDCTGPERRTLEVLSYEA